MPLHPAIAAAFAAAPPPPPFEMLSPAELREWFQSVRAMQGPPEEVAHVADLVVKGRDRRMPVRVYRPPAEELLPLVVALHGGWFVFGDRDVLDQPCRVLANAAPAVVVSVDYALAPEHPHPAGMRDAVDAVEWAASRAAELGGDPARLFLLGESAGAALAASASMALRDRVPGASPVAAQLLVCPPTDPGLDTASWVEYDGVVLDRRSARRFWDMFLAGADPAAVPAAAPLRAADLAGLPPAHVFTAEQDPLRDEGEAYAARLSQAGVPTRLTRYDGMPHGMVYMNGITADTRVLVDDLARVVRGDPAHEAHGSSLPAVGRSTPRSRERRADMRPLNGIHHVTGITADVRASVDFWCRIMGLRFVKKTLNFETTFRYHPYFGDEKGNAGSIVTFLEFNDAPRGRRPGRGNIQRIVLRVASFEALEFWMDRLTVSQVYSTMNRLDPTKPASLVFEDWEGHEVELMVTDAPDAPQLADADDIPEHFRIRGIEGVRSYTAPEDLRAFAEHLGFVEDGERFAMRGETRIARWYFSQPPEEEEATALAVGVWHHVAFDAGDELKEWRDFADGGPVPFTPIYDHYYFDSCYSPSAGGLVELASHGPGFLRDQALEDLGDELTLSPRVEPLRERLERDLTPIDNPRSRRKAKSGRRAGAKDAAAGATAG